MTLNYKNFLYHNDEYLLIIADENYTQYGRDENVKKWIEFLFAKYDEKPDDMIIEFVTKKCPIIFVWCKHISRIK